MSPLLHLNADDAAQMLSGGQLAVNVNQMRKAGPNRRRIYQMIAAKQLRYKREDPEEEWVSYDQVCAEIERNGVAYVDCEDFATLIAAELVADGVDIGARPVVYKSADHLYHVVTWSPVYGYLDGCIPGGMYGEAQ